MYNNSYSMVNLTWGSCVNGEHVIIAQVQKMHFPAGYDCVQQTVGALCTPSIKHKYTCTYKCIYVFVWL